MTDPQIAEIAERCSEAQRAIVVSLPVVRGKRNGQFWASNDANVLADLSHQGLCKMPFADRWGVCDWQFVARCRPFGLAVAAYLKEQSNA